MTMVYMRLYPLLVIFLIISSLPVQSQQIQGRILIDVGHSSQDIQRILNDLARELEINYYTVEFTKTIAYLDPYDVLVIAISTIPFTAEELDSIHQFVENGGGLLLLGESGILTSQNLEDFNVLAGYYGFEFQRDVVVDPKDNLTLDKAYPEIPMIENFANHPVTRNVRKIFFVSGCSMRLKKKAESLAWGGEDTFGDRLSELYGYGGGTYEPEMEKKGKELILMAFTESGKGRIVALGDTSLFRGRAAAGQPWPKDPFQYFDHKRLALNTFGWLSLKTKIGRASELVNEAKYLIEQGKYQEAKDILDDVKKISQQAGDFTIAREVALLLTEVQKGMEADQLLEEGKTYLEELNCEEASKSFEKALTIYESIKNAKKIQECLKLLSECGNTAALLQMADSLLSDGKKAFEQRKFGEAVEKIEEARTIYEDLRNAQKVEECTVLIEEIYDYQRGKRQAEEALQRNRLVLAVILVITAIAVVVIYLWKRSRPSYEDMHPRRPY